MSKLNKITRMILEIGREKKKKSRVPSLHLIRYTERVYKAPKMPNPTHSTSQSTSNSFFFLLLPRNNQIDGDLLLGDSVAFSSSSRENTTRQDGWHILPCIFYSPGREEDEIDVLLQPLFKIEIKRRGAWASNPRLPRWYARNSIGGNHAGL